MSHIKVVVIHSTTMPWSSCTISDLHTHVAYTIIVELLGCSASSSESGSGPLQIGQITTITTNTIQPTWIYCKQCLAWTTTQIGVWLAHKDKHTMSSQILEGLGWNTYTNWCWETFFPKAFHASNEPNKINERPSDIELQTQGVDPGSCNGGSTSGVALFYLGGKFHKTNKGKYKLVKEKLQ